ncbi:MAG: hypothetical protein C4576_13570 [Desulfobacteraceae bacterium]|nr:MAG: hypothetical protein C4576_13570 [Desulfobacteraceae bacterium]
MSRETIDDAQAYLTYISENRIKRIVNVESLLKNHSEEDVISCLMDIYRDKQKFLKIMIDADKTSSRINETIVAMFRIHMAIRVLEGDGKEVMIHERAQSGAESCSRVS